MPPTTEPSTESADVRTLLRPVWRRKWLILLIVAVSTAGAYYQAARKPNLYRSSTQVFVSSSQVNSLVTGGLSAQQTGGQGVADQASLLLSNPVSEAVIRTLHLKTTPGALVGAMSAAPATGTDFITVSAVSGSGAEAAVLANAYVKAYLDYSTSLQDRQAAAAITRLRAQYAALPANSGQGEALIGLIRSLQVLQAAGPNESQQNPAVASTIPFSPRPKRDAAFALVIALTLALALAFGLERLDKRIKDLDEVTAVYGMPLLSVIPHSSAAGEVQDDVVSVPDTLREPLRSLRASMQLASLDKPIKRIAVTSAVSGEGKSTIVRNLALTYRDFGLDVVVVEADLRRPTLSAAFHVPAGAGLTALLTGDCDWTEALVEVQVEHTAIDYLERAQGGGARGIASASGTSSGRLVLLASGPTPPNPQAVLASERMWQVVDELSTHFDIVLIDTAPLLVVSDAIPLLAQCDGVIMVTRVGKTERQEGQRAAAAARLDPSVRVLGVVANDVSVAPREYGYGYSYHSDGR